MSGSVIIGGSYFTDDRINLIQGDTVDWRDVDNLCIPEVGDYVFFVGIKKWVRRLKKARYSYKQIADKISAFIVATAGKRPYGVLDDLNWDDECGVGDRLREAIKPVIYLLREHTGQDGCIPFSIPCDDLYREAEKDISISFYGDASHSDRTRWAKKLKSEQGVVLNVYKGGEKSGDKLPREEYLDLIARSHVALSFRGHGYCCFRYQEIPSVGSCLATPRYPHVIRNDYEDGKTCIKFDTVEEVLRITSNQAQDIAVAGHEHFLKYHTTEVRRNELLEYMDEVRRN
jgi:hypothetical protein